jgi:tripartite ATP-independent transporter DctM subunit
MTEGLVGLLAMLALAFLRVPIALAMGIVGVAGYAYMRDWNWTLAFAMAQTKVYETGRSYTLSVVPLFILMGNFVTRAGMSAELFRAAYAFIGHRRGGLAMATVWASAGFGGICGSSIATAATMAKVAYPSMKSFGYSERLATGAIAAGGTLGIMIPPSTIMVIYGVFTETNIGKLFAAGVVPGLLGATLLSLAVVYTTWRDPTAGPPGRRATWSERARALRAVWAVAALFAFVMGGIYGGLFTATEGAGMGAFGALVFALSRRPGLGWVALYQALLESARTTAMLFLILIGALMFAEFVNITTMPADLTALVSRFELHPTLVMFAICAIYVLLGTAMEELSMVLLTMPVFFPLVVHLGFDPIWFGVIIVCVVEIGLISPPVGMNLFVLKTLLPGVSTGTVFRGVMPFMWADVLRLAILVAFPWLALWLPSLMR